MTKPENLKCPECGLEMVRRTGKFGAFWGCQDYPNCRGTRDIMGRSKEEREQENQDDKDEWIK
jgi:DNA topoisomerase-1